MYKLTMNPYVCDIHKEIFTKELNRQMIIFFHTNFNKINFLNTSKNVSISSYNYFPMALNIGEFQNSIDKLEKVIIANNVRDIKKIGKEKIAQFSICSGIQETIQYKEIISCFQKLLVEKNYKELLKMERSLYIYLNGLDIINENSANIFRTGFKNIFFILYSRFTENIDYENFLMIQNEYFIDKNDIFKDAERFAFIKENWCAYLYTLFLDVLICPYCDSQYVYTYKGIKKTCDRRHKKTSFFKMKFNKTYSINDKFKKFSVNKVIKEEMNLITLKQGGIRPELDHCFPKSKHSFLSVSLYNLIPSCSQCNSSIKGATEITAQTVVNLYTEKIEENYKFYLEPKNNIQSVLGGSLDYDIRIKISNDLPLKDRIRYANFIKSFHIEERYMFLKKHLNEAIYYRINHSDSVKKFLEELMGMSDSNQNVFFETDNNNKIIGKLIQDVTDSGYFKRYYVNGIKILDNKPN